MKHWIKALVALWLASSSAGCAAYHAAGVDEDEVRVSLGGSSRGYGGSAASLLSCDPDEALNAILPRALEEAEHDQEIACRALVVAILSRDFRPTERSAAIESSGRYVSRAPEDALRVLDDAIGSANPNLRGFALMTLGNVVDARTFRIALAALGAVLAEPPPPTNEGWHRLHAVLDPLRFMAIRNGACVRLPGASSGPTGPGEDPFDRLEPAWRELLDLIVPHDEAGLREALNELDALLPRLQAWLTSETLPAQVS